MRKIMLFVILILTCGEINAQFDGGADFVSRYLWRGQLLSSGPVLQPWASYTTTGDRISLEIGAWGSYSFATTLSPDGTLTDGSEADLYVSLGFGKFSLGVTDYFFPSDDAFAVDDGYFDYDNHVIEFNAGYDGPISVAFNYNLSGDTGIDGTDLNSIYTELGYGVTPNVNLFAAIGNGWYTDTQDIGVVGLGITVSKGIAITDNYSLPTFATVAVNPAIEKFYIVFGISF